MQRSALATCHRAARPSFTPAEAPDYRKRAEEEPSGGAFCAFCASHQYGVWFGRGGDCKDPKEIQKSDEAQKNYPTPPKMNLRPSY